MNRRKHLRFHVELRCAFAGDQYTGEGTVLDLSMEGCRVCSDILVLKGAYVGLSIILLGQIPSLPVELAVVRWSTGHVLGLEFIRIVDEHHARLRHYVQELEEALLALGPATSTEVGHELGLSER